MIDYDFDIILSDNEDDEVDYSNQFLFSLVNNNETILPDINNYNLVFQIFQEKEKLLKNIKNNSNKLIEIEKKLLPNEWLEKVKNETIYDVKPPKYENIDQFYDIRNELKNRNEKLTEILNNLYPNKLFDPIKKLNL